MGDGRGKTVGRTEALFGQAEGWCTACVLEVVAAACEGETNFLPP